MSALGLSRPSHFVPVLNNVRYASDSDHSRYESELTLWAKSRHSGHFWILLLAGKGAQVRGASPVKLPRRKFLHLAAGAGQKLAYVYFEDEPGRRAAATVYIPAGPY